MEKLNPRERALIIKRVKELNAQIQNPRLSIERVDALHAERAQLQAQLLEDRAASNLISGCGCHEARHSTLECDTSPPTFGPFLPPAGP